PRSGITALAIGGYEVACQANTGNLWTVGPDGGKDWGLGMMAGTSPSITALANGGYEVAFQAKTGNLWTIGSDQHVDLALGTMAGTSPSITSNTGDVWEVGSDHHGDWRLRMDARTRRNSARRANGGNEDRVTAKTHDTCTREL